MKFTALAILSILLAFSAHAQQAPAAKKGPQPGQISGPCAEDAAKLCKDVAPGGGRIIACLEGNIDKLSPACKTQVTRAKQRQQARAKKAGPPAKASRAQPEAAKKDAAKK